MKSQRAISIDCRYRYAVLKDRSVMRRDASVPFSMFAARPFINLKRIQMRTR
jgi:hypothetical protein